MKKLFTLLFILILVSCEEKNEDSQEGLVNIGNEFPENINTPSPLDHIQGEYEECIESPQWNGYYSLVSIKIESDQLSIHQTLDSKNDCSSPYYKYKQEYTINKIEKLPKSNALYDVTLKMSYIGLSLNHTWYLSQDYCNLTGWSLNTEKEMTGLYCPLLVEQEGPMAGYYQNSGDELFVRYKIEDDGISYQGNPPEEESGLSPSERMISGLVKIKIK